MACNREQAHHKRVALGERVLHLQVMAVPSPEQEARQEVLYSCVDINNYMVVLIIPNGDVRVCMRQLKSGDYIYVERMVMVGC